MKCASFKRLGSVFLLATIGLTLGCPLVTGEVYCKATRDCPEVFRKCDLDGVEDGGVGLCVGGTAPTGIPIPDEALIDADAGLVDGGSPGLSF